MQTIFNGLLNSKEAVTKVDLESYDFAIATLSGTSDADMKADIKLFGRDMTRGIA